MADSYAWLDDLEPKAAEPPPDRVAPGGLTGVITGKAEPSTSTGEAAARGALQGASLGFLDEINAAADTVASKIPGLRDVAEKLNFGGGVPLTKSDATYQERRDAYRTRNKAAADEHPIAYHGSELVGGFAAPIPGGSGRGLVQMVKQGAKAGAIAGLGSSEADLTQGDIGGAARDLAIGTALGAGTATLAHGAGEGVKKLAQGAKGRVLERTSEDVLRGETAARAKTGNKAQERFGEENERLGDLLGREPKLEKLLALKAESSPAKVAKKVTEVSNRLNDELDGIYDQMAKAKRLVRPQEIRAEFDRMVGEATKAGDENVTAALERARDQFAHRYPDAYGPMSPDTLRGYKKSAARAAFAADPTAPASAKAQVGKMVWRTLAGAIEKQAEGSGVDVARLRQLNQDVSVLIPIEQALTERGAAAGRGSLSMVEMGKHAAMSGAASALGFAHGGGAEAAILGLAAPLAAKAGKAALRRADYAASKMAPESIEYAARVSQGLKNGLTLQAASEAANHAQPKAQAPEDPYAWLDDVAAADTHIEAARPASVAGTKLSPAEEKKFEAWRKTLPARLQSDDDYDLRGFWRETPTFKVDTPGQHMTDKFKLPNHETFSNESKYYNDSTKHMGGKWERSKGGSWAFVPNDPKYKRRIEEDADGNRIGG